MADFADQFPDDDLMVVLGDDIEFVPKVGEKLSIKAFMHLNVERIGGDGYTVEQRNEVEILLSDLTDAPRKGDFVKHGSNTYRIDEEVSNDGDYGRYVLVTYG